MKTVTCFHCRRLIEFVDRIPRQETCPQCGSDLHCCKTCNFYDPAAPKECREPIAELVRYKDRANHCDHFDPRPAGDRPIGRPAAAQDQARQAWEDLFKK